MLKTHARHLLATLLLAAASHTAGAQAAPQPASTSACDGLTTTAAMLSCEQTRLQQLSGELQGVIAQLQTQLSPLSKIRLASSQVAWIRYRDSSAALDASTEQGGTLAPLLQVTTKADLTQQRVLQLRKLSSSQGAH